MENSIYSARDGKRSEKSQNKQKCEAKENKNVIIISIIGSYSWFNHTKIISFGIRLRGGCVAFSLCVLVSVRNWNFFVLKFDQSFRESFKTQQKKQNSLRDFLTPAEFCLLIFVQKTGKNIENKGNFSTDILSPWDKVPKGQNFVSQKN